jgi:hypothetical protein
MGSEIGTFFADVQYSINADMKTSKNVMTYFMDGPSGLGK